jgi:thiol-disulfide isomerase/thioredoxin
MSESGGNWPQASGDRGDAQQAAARAGERQRTFMAVASVVLVIAIVLAFILVKLNKSTSSGSVTGTALPASVMTNVTTVPASALDAVGTGSVLSFNPKPVSRIAGPPLTANGKPEMLYIGAEFCPYCAAMRWAMAVALSRFGSFAPPLRGIHSSGTDVYPNTPTLTFYKAKYTSKYLTFTPVENETISGSPLQSTTAAQQAIWAKYEPNPSTRGYPFIDFGNRYLIQSPIYSPAVLAGKTWAQVAAALHDPSSPIARGALGAANYITAAICKITDNTPSAVCSTRTVAAIQAGL